jgi:glycerophosphoryl diester phosphodiesterase
MTFLDGTRPIAFAHRGYAPDGCENSMAAFERALDLGYRYLETDVRVTADGVAVVFHDASLDRVTDGRGRLAELPWERVRRAHIRGREPIPRLVDLLGAWPAARINLDVKSDACIAPTIEAIRQTGSVGRVCVGSFSGARVGLMRGEFGESLCTSLAPREVFALRLAASRRSARPGSRPETNRCAQVPVRIGRLGFADRRLIDAAHGVGMPIHVWTVNRRADMVRLLDDGVDGIMTDDADVLRDVLVARGEWSPGDA